MEGPLSTGPTPSRSKQIYVLASPEVLSSLGHDVVVELELDPAGVLTVDVDVEVDDRPGAWGSSRSVGPETSVWTPVWQGAACLEGEHLTSQSAYGFRPLATAAAAAAAAQAS